MGQQPEAQCALRRGWPHDPESDLARIVRDHTFIKVLASTAESEGLTNPLKANAFLGALANPLTKASLACQRSIKTVVSAKPRDFYILGPASLYGGPR